MEMDAITTGGQGRVDHLSTHRGFHSAVWSLQSLEFPVLSTSSHRKISMISFPSIEKNKELSSYTLPHDKNRITYCLTLATALQGQTQVATQTSWPHFDVSENCRKQKIKRKR